MTLGSGIVTLAAPTADSAAMMVLKNALNLALTRSYKATAYGQAGSEVFFPIGIARGAVEPPLMTSANWSNQTIFHIFIESGTHLVICYRDSLGASYYWNGSIWTTTYSYAATVSSIYYDFIIETNGVQIRAVVKRTDNQTVITTTPWVSIANLLDYSAGAWLILGEPLSDAWAGTGVISSMVVA